MPDSTTMPDQPSIPVFVKLGYWELYWTVVFLTRRQFRVLLIPATVVGTLLLALFAFTWVHPGPQQEWFEVARNVKPILWVFGTQLAVVFVFPLISTRRLLTDWRLSSGVRYLAEEGGLHVDNPIAKTDLQWAGICEA